MLLDYNVNQVIVEWQGRDPDAERLTDIDRQKFREMVMQQYPINLELWDQGGHLFIGHSHNLTYRGVPLHVAEQMLDEDVEEAEKQARTFFTGFDTLGDVRGQVLVNMAFNIAPSRLAGFVGFQGALQAGKYEEAARQMLLNSSGDGASKWAAQVGYRALELAYMMAWNERWKKEKNGRLEDITADEFPPALRQAAQKVIDVIEAKKRKARAPGIPQAQTDAPSQPGVTDAPGNPPGAADTSVQQIEAEATGV
jgi:hypothetical protein